ncbi:MAG: hypothetical protein R2932_12080 [Caldilineaceae bacterium]
MGENRSLLTTLGAILGLVIAIFVVMQAVSYYQSGVAEFEEMQRQAGVPILLSETLHEGATTDTSEAITATVSTSETVPAVTTAISATTEMTGTTAVTGTTGMTSTTELTGTESLTGTAVVTSTEAAGSESTETTEVITTAITTMEIVTTTEVITTVEIVTATEVTTETEEAAAVDEAAAEATTATTAADAPGAAVALAVPSPEEVTPIITKAGCMGCHVIPGIPGAVGVIGPDLSNVGARAATRIEGYTATEYLYESLLQPNAYVVDECPTGPCLPGLMIQNLGDILTPEELDTVVGYLSSLKTEE